MTLALDEPDLSPRELAVRFTDTEKYFVSEVQLVRVELLGLQSELLPAVRHDLAFQLFDELLERLTHAAQRSASNSSIDIFNNVRDNLTEHLVPKLS